MTETCWICGSSDLVFRKKSDVNSEGLNSHNFAITNADYGKTGELHQCQECGFLQCIDIQKVLSYYEDLEDTEYESGRDERKLQEQKIVELALKFKPSGKLLDIGAGSGMLVESALEHGYEAEGVEPSNWLRKQAIARGLPIHQGIFPQKDALKGPYDVVTLIDVIEHVPNPKELVKEISKVLKPGAIFIMVTPDMGSVMAKLLGWKWWHYRFAHIGYFNKKTLKKLTDSADFTCIRMLRPSWYFRCGYLTERLNLYMPRFLQFPLPSFCKNTVIPLNLRDSLLGVYKKK